MADQPHKIPSGTRLAIVLAVGGVILSALATKYRIFSPETPTTAPSTQPAEPRPTS